MKNRGTFLRVVRERAAWPVAESVMEHPSEWAAITSVAAKMGCTSETLRKWVRQAERNAGKRPALVRRARGHHGLSYLLLKRRFMVANPIRTAAGLSRFRALGLPPPLRRAA
jgi:hypothetical protein